MSDAATTAENTADDHLGVLATWRATPGQVKALLAGVFVSKFAGFIQIFLILFLTHRGFSSGEAGLALGVYGAGAVVGTFAGGYVPSLWGGSGFSLSSVLFAVGGGIAGVWLGVRLSA